MYKNSSAENRNVHWKFSYAFGYKFPKIKKLIVTLVHENKHVLFGPIIENFNRYFEIGLEMSKLAKQRLPKQPLH